MIKKICSIKKFGSFNGFSWPGDVPNFDKKNILYGWNYSGKTTISRIFSSINDKKLHIDYLEAEFELELSDGSKINHANIESATLNIEVFNSDFIKSNLHWDTEKGSDSIAFDIGEDIYGYRLQKQTNEKAIEQATLEIESLYGVEREFNRFDETLFTAWAKDIRTNIFNNEITFNKTHVSKITEAIKTNAKAYLISEKHKLQDIRAQAIQAEVKQPVEVIATLIHFNDFRQEVVDILHAIPQKEKIMKHLDKSEYYHWAKQGLHLELIDRTNECPFCGGTLTTDQLEELSTFFSNEGAILKERILNCKEKLDTEITSIENVAFNKSINDYMPKCKNAFQTHLKQFDNAKETYKSLLIQLKNELEKKEKEHLFNYITIDSNIPESEQALSEWITIFNKIATENNQAVIDFENDKATAKDALQKHYIADHIISESYIETESKATKASENRQKLSLYILKLEKENEELQSKLDNIAAGKDELNKYISLFLGRDDIHIDLTKDNKFLLKRETSIAKNLSEGEKMAIAFAYFLIKLEGLHTKGKLLQTIVYIDDPISSLDINHISQVYSMINSFFFRKGLDETDPNKITNCFLQLFLSTHNFEFFSFLRDSSMIHRKDTKNTLGEKTSSHQYYLIARGHQKHSTISKLPKPISKYKSEYVYLFSLIDAYHKAITADPQQEYDHEILIPNALRRFIEIYSLMKLPHESESFENRFAELAGTTNQIKVLNHFSHFTTFEKVIKHDDLISILPKATEELFTLLKLDSTHYASLQRAIK